MNIGLENKYFLLFYHHINLINKDIKIKMGHLEEGYLIKKKSCY